MSGEHKRGEPTLVDGIEREALRKFSQTFLNRLDLYAIQRNDGGYLSITSPITDQVIADHLTGKHTIGTYALDAASWASWLVIDADDDLHFQKLIALSEQLHSEGVPTYLENSRRGGHLWLFFSPIPGFQARRFGKQLITEAQLPFSNPQRKKAGVELYPKQDQLVTGVGSLVRLPLGIHRLNSTRYGFIYPTGVSIAPTAREQAQLLGNPEQVSISFIDTLLERAPEPYIPPPTGSFIPQKTKEADYSFPLSTRIKQAISVHDFVSRYIEIDAMGRGKCPFHDDQHQSFQVHSERNFWHCYAGCGGGSIIHFYQKLKGIDAPHLPKNEWAALLRELAIEVGI